MRRTSGLFGLYTDTNQILNDGIEFELKAQGSNVVDDPIDFDFGVEEQVSETGDLVSSSVKSDPETEQSELRENDETVDKTATSPTTEHTKGVLVGNEAGVTVTGTAINLTDKGAPPLELTPISNPVAPQVFTSQALHMTEDAMAMNPHPDGSPKFIEHADMMKLVQLEDATHTAINSGDWFDASTWENGQIPGDDARVVIPEGIEVNYNGESDQRLFTVRVDGALDFATDIDTKMVIDTMVVTASGTLTIGTEDDPVQEGVSANIVIANNGDIDVNWDPGLLSRGIVAHGTTEMHGQEKTSHLKVETDPVAGDTSFTLAEVPTNWQIGDTLVMAGTRFSGHGPIGSDDPYTGTEDEVLTITKINGNVVSFDTPLVYDHDSPRADLKTSVANYSRNIRIETEDPETAAVHERGHVMFMHSDNVDVRFVEFHELGRTDKSERSTNVYDIENLESDSNAQGRYSVHLHRTGVNDVEDPGIIIGSTVFGSPGWGFVHHDSHAILQDNASFDTFGAGFVAETGNETGDWIGNIAIKAEGTNSYSKNAPDVAAFDLARVGVGFWFQGRMVDAKDNVAASVSHGFTYMVRGTGVIDIEPEQYDLSEALGLLPRSIQDAPITQFSNNEAFATTIGLEVIKSAANQEHDVRSILDGFTAWEVLLGANVEYTAHYTVKNFDLTGISLDPDDNRIARTGFSIGKNSTDMTLVDFKVEGFADGINLSKTFTVHIPEELRETNYIVINPEFTNNVNDFSNFDPDADLLLDWDDLELGRFNITHHEPLIYSSSATPTNIRVEINGTKLDSIGEIRLAAGTDNYDIIRDEVIETLNEVGYYLGDDDNPYFLLESYYSDRVSGEIFKFGELVRIGDDIQLGSFSYADATVIGTINLDSIAPETNNENLETEFGTELTVDLTANDTDADGDTLEVNGIIQPKNGTVFNNGDGTVTYRPDYGFSGVDTFKYWVTDGNANYTEAFATIEVLAKGIETPGDEAIIDASDLPDGAFQSSSLNLGEGVVIQAVAPGSVTAQEINGTTDFSVSNGDMANSVFLVAGVSDTPVLLPDDVATGQPSWSDVTNEHGLDTALENGAMVGNAASVWGTDFDDTFTGEENNDIFYGEAGDDTIVSGSGNDKIYGGTGDDTIYAGRWRDTVNAGDGDDTVWGGAGRDVINLGKGNDVFEDEDATGFWQSDTVNGGAGNDIINARGGHDILNGGVGNDTIFGGVGNDVIDGGGWADVIDAGDGNDTVRGGTGRDVIQLGAGNDVFEDEANTGYWQSDTINGGAGDDTINGRGGNEIITGGTDNDLLTGGVGNDTFAFTLGDGQDVITDFEDGVDVISFSGSGLQFTDLSISTDANGDALVAYGSGDLITLSNAGGLLDVNDFGF